MPKIEAKASAKLEAVAKATYQRKRITTEIIPPDVTRAKADRWLDLISPITEWAGLKGDALRFRRKQLRIQQEESLDILARFLSEKVDRQAVRQPVPLKILVPALEKASLEDPGDVYMIDKWAELLAASATESNVAPRFVEILGEVTGSQARLLEEIFFKDEETEKDELNYDWIICELDASYLQRHFKKYPPKKMNSIPLAWNKLVPLLKNRGLLLLKFSQSTSTFEGVNARKYFNAPRQTSLDLDVLRSLHLIEQKRYTCSIKNIVFDLSYYQITDVGLNFLRLCSPRARNVLIELAADKSGRFFSPVSAT